MSSGTGNEGKPSGRHRSKPAVKRDHIATTLRRRIVEGRYPPGSRLPLRTELEREFKAGPVTVQRALDRLADDGFVHARGRGGTYVADHPPHLARYGLVFPRRPGDEHWNRFWTALSSEAGFVEQNSARQVSLYHGLDVHAGNADYDRLMADIGADRLAGVIFASHPDFVVDTPLLSMPGLPKVVVLCEHTWPGISAVELDSHGVIDVALDHFAARGRQRVAVVSLIAFAEANHSYLASRVRDLGMTMRPYWVQALVHSPPRWVQSCAHLLMHPQQSERPDALLIADDNLIEPVTAGLVAAGVRVPEDLEIVGHCNFPWPAPSHLPVTRVGYDTRQLLLLCMESVDRQRRGDHQPYVMKVPPRLGGES